MPHSYPACVAEADLDAAWIERLQREADRALSQRAMTGGAAYAVIALGFSLASDLGRRFPVFSAWVTAAAFVAFAVRFRVLSSEDAARTAEKQLGWRRAAAATSYACVGLWALHVSIAIHLLGIGTTTMLMLMASTGFAVGLARSLAPRQALVRGCVALVLVPLVCAALQSPGGSEKYGAAALMALLLPIALFHGHRLGNEYWESAVARAQLQISRDRVVRAERQTRELIEKTPHAMGIVSAGEIVFVNPAWTSSLQYESVDLVGKLLEHITCPADVERLRRFLDSPRLEPSSTSQEFGIVKRDGTHVTWEVSPGETLEYDGRIARPVIARDVTERNRMRAQLLVSERLASVGTLAAGVGHEINNPLTYVLANLDYAVTEMRKRTAMDAAKTTELAELMEEALTGANRVRVIVRDLRLFSRVGETASSSVDVHSVIDLAIKITGGEARRRARVVVVPSELPAAAANGAELGQAIVNLVMNATYAIAEGRPDENEIRIATRTDASGHIVIEVTDTGAGIAPAHLSRVFDPFFTTKPIGVGTGLGLSVCHSSIRSFGGDIAVTSELGRGTTFTIRLLPAVERTTPVVGLSNVQDPVGRARARLLVIDDELAVGTSVQRAFRDHYDVILETTAPAALARLEAGEAFDVVLCDLMMPDVNGMELFALIDERLPHYAPRVVFMTGGAFTATASDFLERVPNARLDKPFDLAKLRATVKHAVNLVRRDEALAA